MFITQVGLTMKTSEGNTVERAIDISNIQYPCGEYNRTATNPEQQKALLENWIEERGNEQHDTELTLISWWIK